jgi:hypothetical protein
MRMTLAKCSWKGKPYTLMGKAKSLAKDLGRHTMGQVVRWALLRGKLCWKHPATRNLRLN